LGVVAEGVFRASCWSDDGGALCAFFLPQPFPESSRTRTAAETSRDKVG